MLSVAPIGNAEYYLNLAREDYYLSGGEPPGLWLGSAATALGLSGTVNGQDFRQLLAGYGPDGTALIQNAGDDRHQMGWDLTFSAPKGVSIAWGVSGRERRRELKEAHESAVRAAMDYVERNATFSRRGKGGAQREPSELLVAAFEHGTSRAQDPQLHTHCLVVNVARRPDGTFGTIESLPLYRHKMTAGAIYRAELAHQLQQLGYVIDRKGNLFDIRGIPEKLIEHFSKRRAAIQEALQSYGAESAKAAELANKLTRDPKNELPRTQLIDLWQTDARQMGFREERLRPAISLDEPLRTIDELICEAIHGPRDTERYEKRPLALAEEQSYFSEQEIVRKVAELAPGHRLSARTIQDAVRGYLETSADIVSLGPLQQEPQFTTGELFQKEQTLLQHVRELAARSGHQVTPRTIQQVLDLRPELSPEQQAAVRHLTGHHDVALVNGLPGTGKTTMLATCRDAWERAGYNVVGCTVSAKAARELSQGAGIQSFTIAKVLDQWLQTPLDVAKHQAAQIARAARGKKTYKPETIPLGPNTVLVVDEAGMVDTRQLHALAQQVRQQGAKLILVGDTRQLPAIGPGGAFEALCQEHGAAELADMRRQRNTRDIEALQAIARGDATSALESFQLRDMLVLAETKEQAIQQLIEDWKPRGLLDPRNTSIITTTNREAAEINRRCQEERLKTTGDWGASGVVVNGQQLLKGDRVLFQKNSRSHGVLNGDLGTVIDVDILAKRIDVLLDPGPSSRAKTVRIPIKSYDQISLGYARTTHKEQGATVEHAFVLLGGAMQDKEISFVQASRHREQVKFYADRLEAGHELEGLVEQMTRSGSKMLAHTLREVTTTGASKSRRLDEQTPEPTKLVHQVDIARISKSQQHERTT